MAEVETQVLARLLKVLDRTVKAGENLDPFRYVTSAKSSPRKKVVKNKKDDNLPNGDTTNDRRSVEEEDAREKEPEVELTSVDYEKLEKVLYVARESILAADCCIALLGSDRLTKQVRFLSPLSHTYTHISCSSTRKNSSYHVSTPSKTNSRK
jgi:cohesin loading factor subunit SCC2